MTSFPNLDDLPDEARAISELFSGSLIYLAAPYAHPDPAVRRDRVEQVSRYASHLLRQRETVFSPLSHGAAMDSAGIPDSVWYALGLRIMTSCDELRLLALDGWEESAGVHLELRYAQRLDLPVSVVDPDTYDVRPWKPWV